MLRLLPPAAAALALTACAGGPDYDPAAAVDVRGAYAALPQDFAPANDDWIAAFGDPQLVALVDRALERMISLGLTGVHDAGETVDVGEGLVGQVAKIRQPRLVRDLPPGYCEISSATGSAPPREVFTRIAPSRIAARKALSMKPMVSFVAAR